MSGPPSTQPYGPDEHKALVRQLGLRNVDDLLALHRSNDPFFRGSPAHWRDARWFAGIWEQAGFVNGVHLRRIHYRILGTGERLPGSGDVYENLDLHWSTLSSAGKSARLLGLVNPEAFIDQRNDAPQLHVYPRLSTPEPEWETAGDTSWTLPMLGSWQLEPRPFHLPGVQVTGYDYEPDDQPVLLELWIEKSTMNDVLGPVCRQLGINLVTGTGFQSITGAISLLRRAERHGKPAHVFYVSDFDPAGVAMPVSVARQAQFWAGKRGIDAELTLHPIVLTAEQVAEYDLPRIPVKLDKHGQADPRGKKFEAQNGEGVVELDALEGRHPGVLADLVRQAAEPYIDAGLPDALAQTGHAAQVEADQQWLLATTDLRADLAELTDDVRQVTDRYRARLAELGRELHADLRPYQERLDELRDQAAEAADDFEVELPARPVAAEPDVDRDGLLYDSTRHWWDQIQRFKASDHHSPPDP